MFSKKDYVGNDDKVGNMLEDIIQSLINKCVNLTKSH